MKKNTRYAVAAAILIVGFGVVYSYKISFRIATASMTPEASQIISVAERMAKFTDLGDAKKLEAEFNLPPMQSHTSVGPTRCPDHAIQHSHEWGLNKDTGAWWFIPADQPNAKQTFSMQVDEEPITCPTDGLQYTVAAYFLNIDAWHCIHESDLGNLAHAYTTVRTEKQFYVKRQDIPRADGRTARLELVFQGKSNEACLRYANIQLHDHMTKP